MSESQGAVLVCPNPFDQVEDIFIGIGFNWKGLIVRGLPYPFSKDFQIYFPIRLAHNASVLAFL